MSSRMGIFSQLSPWLSELQNPDFPGVISRVISKGGIEPKNYLKSMSYQNISLEFPCKTP